MATTGSPVAIRPSITIRPVRPADAEAWHRMRCLLWSGEDGSHREEIEAFFLGKLGEPAAAQLAETADGVPVAVLELSIRTDIAGLEGQRTGYIEGLFVYPEFRSPRLTRRLLYASRDWAREQRCTAFASDRDDRVIIDRSFEREGP